MILTPEEEMLLAAYGEVDRQKLIKIIHRSEAYIDGEEVSELAAGLAAKLERMTDEQFDELLNL